MNTPSPVDRLLLCALTIGLNSSIHAEDWTRFRGPEGKGIASGESIPLEWSATENIAWTAALPGRGASSPVVWGDHIYLTCFTGSAEGGEPLRRQIVCLAKDDGDEIWRHTIPAAMPEQAAIREDHGYATNSVAVDAERVYAFLGKSGVIALTHGGEELWRASVGSTIHGWGSAASPIVFEDKVLINASVESEALIALDAKTGDEIWRLPGIKESWNTPVIATLNDGGHEIVLAMFRKVLGVDPDTGKLLWECDTQINWYMCPGMIAEDGVVYAIGGRSGGGLAVRAGGRGDVTESHLLWRLNKGTNVPTPILHDGHLYFIHENLSIAYCINAETGETVYEERIPSRFGGVYGSPFLANGRIYYLSRNGVCVVLPAAPRFDVLARNELPRDAGVYNASPTAMGNQLLIRVEDTLFCVGE